MTKKKMQHDYQLSYWQQGCNDARSGKPFDYTKRIENGYSHGYFWGQFGRSPFEDELTNLEWSDRKEQSKNNSNQMPDPPLKNPYMEAIEAIEGILQRLRTFNKEFPHVLSKQQVDDYAVDLLCVRHEFHCMWLDEEADKHG